MFIMSSSLCSIFIARGCLQRFRDVKDQMV